MMHYCYGCTHTQIQHVLKLRFLLGVGGEECTATVIFLLTLACLETFIRSRTKTSFSPLSLNG